MTSAEAIAALGLPEAARVERRIPKTLLAEHGAATAADRRAIAEHVEELRWHAALKATTIGVPEYRDTEREYLEIALLGLRLRGKAPAARLVELVHRAIPYPVLLVTELGRSVWLSLAHKRWSLGEAGRTVLEGGVIASGPLGEASEETLVPFLGSLALDRQQLAALESMRTLYQSWMDRVTAFEAARRTGRFMVAATPADAAARQASLAEVARLEVEISRLRSAAAKESQIARRVELNLELQRLEVARAVALARL